MRSNLGNCFQASKPFLSGDPYILEKVQIVVTWVIPELWGLPRKERLQKIDLFAMSLRRLRGYLNSMYRILSDTGYTRYKVHNI